MAVVTNISPPHKCTPVSATILTAHPEIGYEPRITITTADSRSRQFDRMCMEQGLHPIMAVEAEGAPRGPGDPSKANQPEREIERSPVRLALLNKCIYCYFCSPFLFLKHRIQCESSQTCTYQTFRHQEGQRQQQEGGSGRGLHLRDCGEDRGGIWDGMDGGLPPRLRHLQQRVGEGGGWRHRPRPLHCATPHTHRCLTASQDKAWPVDASIH